MQTLLQYEDGYQYQNILDPLVAIEAEEDKRMKERQREDDVVVHWGEGLNRRTLAMFRFARYAPLRPMVFMCAWCVVRGAWCVVRGAWCVVRGAWCVVRVRGACACVGGDGGGDQCHGGCAALTRTFDWCPATSCGCRCLHRSLDAPPSGLAADTFVRSSTAR